MAESSPRLWTDDQVASLNAFQQSGYLHPFTCGSGQRTDAKHLDGEGLLVATPHGWICPYCDYTQTSCFAWMANWEWQQFNPFATKGKE